MSFYRTAADIEIGAVVETSQRKIGFELKFSSAPKVTKSFWQAREDLQLDAAYVVAPAKVISVKDIGPAMARPC